MRARWHLRANAVVVVWLIAAAVVSIAHRAIPAAPWLMVHLLMLGGVTAAILIWSAHFTQALRRRDLPTGLRGQAVRLAGHSIGAILVIVGVVGVVPVTLWTGASILATVAVWHCVELYLASRHRLGGHLAWSTWGYVGSAVALAVGVTCGVFLADGGAAVTMARLYVGHTSAVLLGWVGLTIVTTLITLWPTVLAVRLTPTAMRLGRIALATVGGALAVVGVGILTDLRLVAVIGYAVYAAGLLIAAVPMATAARAKPPTAAAALHLAFGVAWLTVTVVVWAAVLGLADGWEGAEARLGGLIAPIIAGAAAQILLGALSHLMPMVLGGGPAAVRAARAQVQRGGTARVVLFNGGMLMFVLPTPSLVTVIGSLLALGASIASLVAIVSAVVVSRRTQRDAAQAGPVVLSVEEIEKDRHPRGRGAALIAGCALLVSAAVGVGADTSAAGFGARDAVQSVAATGKTVEVQVEAKDMRFTPSTIEVDPGDRLVIHVTNTDDVGHDLVMDSGASTGRLAAGESATVDIGVVGRDMDGWCSVAGHRQMGMTLTVELTGDPQVGAEPGESHQTPGNDMGSHDMGDQPPHVPGDADLPTASAADAMDLMGEPTVRARDAALAPAEVSATGDAVTHEVTIEVTDVVTEVAPGATQTLWTFNGGPTGPTLRGKVGDTFVVTLLNNGTMGHSLDFHASNVAPQPSMRTIEPGESLVYTFVAKRAGAWLYHCSTSPMSIHIANGMIGAVIIDPPDLVPVDREFAFVQSEYYLGEQGGIVDADKVNDERADLVVFNGYANQYRDEPIDVEVGERVRLWVVDAGPNRATSFHVVGGQFDTVYSEGAYALGGPGAQTVGGAQALALQPGQGGFVELTFPEPGQYPFVSHIMIDAERGAAGLFNVTDPGTAGGAQ